MSIDVRRLRPSRTTLIGLVGALFALAIGPVRDFVWADLREGLVRTDALPRTTRALIRLGFVLLFVMLGFLLFNDVLRGSSPLLAAVGGTAGRGVLLPTVLLPVTMFMIAVAWTLLLTGAIHSHPAIRVAILVAYLGTTIGWLGGGLFASGLDAALSFGALGTVVVFFALRWRGVPRPALEFPVLLALVGVAYAMGHADLVATYQASGVPIFLQTLESTILQLGSLVTPLLVLIGIDIAEFAYRAATWTVGLVSSRLGKIVLGIALALALGWQLFAVLSAAVTNVGRIGLVAHLGALGTPIVVGLGWLLVTRLDRDVSDDDRSPDAMVDIATRNAGRLAFGFFGWSMALTVVTFVLLAAVTVLGTRATGIIQPVFNVFDGLTGRGSDVYRVVFDVVVFGIGAVVARRGRHVIGLYLVLVGAMDGWILLTSPGAPLAALTWENRTQVTLWWVLAAAATALVLLATRRMSVQRAEGLLLLTVMTILAGGAEAVEDPFSPFFAFAGVGLIAFGIIWDAVTVGTWANEDSPALPRVNRMLLYLGYVLFSVTVINWAVTTHDLSDVAFYTGGASTIGFSQFGVPLVYALYALLLARIIRPPAEPAPDVAPDVAPPSG